MHRKCDLTTNVITKYKARLNIHNGKQVYDMNYHETYAPVVMWYAICLVVTISTLFDLALRQIILYLLTLKHLLKLIYTWNYRKVLRKSTILPRITYSSY